MNAFLQSGYPYELAGLLYYAFFLVMSRRRDVHFSRRSQLLTLLTAIVLVASVPLHYANNAAGQIVMLVLAVASLVSTWLDRRTPTSR